ncbi:unnamed protein product [Bursaphelenchus okinawaensis]|uniref:Ig-like domain-containing protein n=1 Tax=Bursaphelenchus okinawaensis TaxID=465554 RepID=A0A811LCX8_9BILA|nr:unnamed protein product [Bursaphelenchus okinawaensis]CAG9121614.1 unnamed protein product [Bursaphelenchus okinawaensis]
MPPLLQAEDQQKAVAMGEKPSTTTISTIAVRAEPHTTIVLAMLKSEGDIHLRIDEMNPRLLEIGETMEDAETLFDSHTDLTARLATKESQVEELLTRANELAHEQEDHNVYVYESMAESLTLAWRELNKQLELRGYILEDVLRFHEAAKQHEKLVAKVHHYLKKLIEDEDDPKTIQTVKNTVDEIIQTTVEAIGAGTEVITQIRVLGALADNDNRLNEVVDSCLIIEKIMLKMSNEWEYVETVWTEEKQRLEVDQELEGVAEEDQGTLKRKKPEEAPKKVNHGKLGAQLNGIDTWLSNSKKKLKRDPNSASQILAEGNTQKDNLARIEDIVQKNIPQSPLATKVDSLKNNIHKFLDELQSEGRAKSQVETFLQNAKMILNQLDQMERDLKVASAALASELSPLAKNKTKKVIDEGTQILRQENNLIVREMLEKLNHRLREVEELASYRVNVNRRLSDKLVELNDWLKRVAEPFLADNGHIGSNVQSASEFLNAHKKFETLLVNKEQEVNSVVQQGFELNEDGQQQIKEFRQRYEILKSNLDKRIEMGLVLQKVFKLSDDLDQSFKTLTDSLNDKDLYKNELAFNDLTKQLQNAQESLAQEKHQVQKLSSIAKSSQPTDLNLRSQKVEESLATIVAEHEKVFHELQEELRNWQLKRDARKAASKTVEEVQIWQVETNQLLDNLETKAKNAKPAEEGKVKTELGRVVSNLPIQEQQEKIIQVQQHVQQSEDADLGQKLDYLHRDHQLLKRRLSDLEQSSRNFSETVAEEETTVITRFPSNSSIPQIQHSYQIPKGHAPNLLQGLENLEVTEGGPIELMVKIDSEPPSSVKWLKDGRVIKSSPDYRQNFDGEVATLRIDEVFPEDSANYTFIAENLHGTAQSVAQLVVKSRSKNATPLEDKPRFVRQLQNVDVRDGATAVLECVCVAKPEPQVTWYKEETVIRESDRIRIDYTGDKCVLRILGAGSSDSGLYKVVAKNIHGESINFCRLQIQPGQERSNLPPFFDPPLMNKVVAEGEGIVLEVKAFGDPIPNIEWTLNEKPLTDSENLKVINEKDGWSRIRIESVNHDNTGLYSVRAINPSGEAKTAATLNLVLQPKPSQIIHSQQSTITRRSSSPRQEHYNQEKQVLIQQLQKVHQDYHSNYSTERTTPNLLHKTQSAYENRFPPPEDCTDFGFSSLANAPQFIRPFQDEYTVNEGEKIQLDCLMVGNPRPKVQWFFNDRPIKSNWHFAEFPNIGDTYYISFAPAKLENSGLYRIVAENIRGRTESSTLIHVRPKSMIPPPSRKTPQRFIQKDFGATDYAAASPTYFSDRGSTTSPARRLSQSAYQPRDLGQYERYVQSQSLQYYQDDQYQQNLSRNSNFGPNLNQPLAGMGNMPEGPQGYGDGSSSRTSYAYDSKDDIRPFLGQKSTQNSSFEKYQARQEPLDQYLDRGGSYQGEYQAKGGPYQGGYQAKTGPYQGEYQASGAVYQGQNPAEASGQDLSYYPSQGGHLEPYESDVYSQEQYQQYRQSSVEQKDLLHRQPSDLLGDSQRYQAFDSLHRQPSEPQQQAPPLQHDLSRDSLHRQPSDIQPPHFLHTLQSYVATIGEKVQFDAIVTANPLPIIEWTKDDHLIDERTHPNLQFVHNGNHVALIVNNAQVEDCGKYMCTVRNELGVATSSAQFVVRPNTIAPDFIQRLISEEVAERDMLRWTVEITGDPEPQVIWLRNGDPIPNCPEVQLLNEGNGVHSLVIPSVEQADGGQFTCIAENVAGEARSTADLVVRPVGSEPGAYFHITKVTQEKRVNGEDVSHNQTLSIESPKQH